MRALVVSIPRQTPPPDVVLGMVDAAEAWQERWSGSLESFGLFPGGGGYGVVDVADEAELHRLMAEMPFSPFNEVTIRVIVDGATGWRQMREAIALRMQR